MCVNVQSRTIVILWGQSGFHIKTHSLSKVVSLVKANTALSSGDLILKKKMDPNET